MFLFIQNNYFSSGEYPLIRSNGALATVIYFLCDTAEVWFTYKCTDWKGTTATKNLL
jgi:hypothetical protein